MVHYIVHPFGFQNSLLLRTITVIHSGSSPLSLVFLRLDYRAPQLDLADVLSDKIYTAKCLSKDYRHLKLYILEHVLQLYHPGTLSSKFFSLTG